MGRVVKNYLGHLVIDISNWIKVICGVTSNRCSIKIQVLLLKKDFSSRGIVARDVFALSDILV